MFQQWLPIITESSKIQCRMVIPQVLNENQLLFLSLTRFLHVSAMVTNNTEMSKILCKMVIPQVLDENPSLFFILTRFLYVFSVGNG